MNPSRFVFAGLPTRVIFGHGTVAQVADEVERLGSGAAFLVHTPRTRAVADAIRTTLGPRCTGSFDAPRMHTPVAVTDTALTALRDSGAGCLVALGGGTAIGLVKALALQTGAKSIVLPTSYAGSEMTDILGQTDDGGKTTLRDPAVRPAVVIYDVDLTLDLPPAVSAASAFNALSHAIDGLFAPDLDPLSRHMAEDAVAMIARALPQLANQPHDSDLRAALLRAAWYASAVLAGQPMALQHKLAHVIGGRFNTDHASTHAALLPYTTAYNAGAAQERLSGLHRALGPSVAAGLWDLAGRTGTPRSLQSLGLDRSDLAVVADEALRAAYANPRPLERGAIEAMLQQAWTGARPD